MQPQITTLIPTYRRPHLLKHAIESALAQTYPHLIVQVLDNCSEDTTEILVHELMQKDARLRYHKHPHPLSAVENFQYGLDHLTTPFFSFLADDDRLLPHFYAHALESLQHHPSASFFLGSTIDISSTGQPISANALRWPDQSYFEPPEGVLSILRHYFNWTGALFKRSVAEALQLNPRLKPIDLDFVTRAALRFSFCMSKTPCALFTHHSLSYSTQAGLKLIWPSWVELERELLTYPSLTPQFKQRLAECLAMHLRATLQRLAASSLATNQPEETIKILALLQQASPFSLKQKIYTSSLSIFNKNHLFRLCFKLIYYVFMKIKRFKIRKYRLVLT